MNYIRHTTQWEHSSGNCAIRVYDSCVDYYD